MELRDIYNYMPSPVTQHQFGDCGMVVYDICKRALADGIRDFIVVDGVVRIVGNEDEEPTPHTWIERRGKVIDPTANQFGPGAELIYSPDEEYREEFSPQEYVADFERQYGRFL